MLAQRVQSDPRATCRPGCRGRRPRRTTRLCRNGDEGDTTHALTLIEAVEASPDEDEAVHARLRGATAVHRALREDAAPRWVAVTRLDAAQPPAGRGGAAGPPPDAYETVHDDGAVDGDGGVVLIVAWEASEDDDEGFRAGWEAVRAAEAAQRGCLGIRLHRSVGPARLRWVQIARWSSPLMVHRARQLPGVREAAEALPATHAALYLVAGA